MDASFLVHQSLSGANICVYTKFTEVATGFVFYESVYGFLYALGNTATLIQFRQAGELHRLPKEGKLGRGESPAL